MRYDNDFVLQEIPGKGKGMIADRLFSRGEIVFSESPFLVQDISRNNSTVLAALSKCTAAQRDQYYALHNCHGERLPTALGIFESNVLPCGGNDAHGHRANRGAVFLLASKFNSSCAPNMNNTWDNSRGQIVFRAVRDIQPGEEMCIGYGNLLATRDERRRELMVKFGFECVCEACVQQGQALEESDVRRQTLSILYRMHSQGSCNDPMESIGEAMLALGYLQAEELPVYQSAFYYTGFHVCASVSDFASAKAWATKAREASFAAFGEQNASVWKSYIHNPAAYPEAGSLGKRTLASPESPLWAFLGLGIGA